MSFPLPALALAPFLATTSPAEVIDQETIARIKMEGFQRSQVMEVVFQLTDVHGPRLHGSEDYDRAAAWARDLLLSWGVDSAQIETWPSPVPGWALSSFSIELIAPSYQRLEGYPMAWSPGTEGVVEGTPVLVPIENEESASLESHRGKLRGKIVLHGRAERPRTEDGAERIPPEEI
ncbi:MAG TPA: peptidase M28, partial [Vicinamibacteria bacterium]